MHKHVCDELAVRECIIVSLQCRGYALGPIACHWQICDRFQQQHSFELFLCICSAEAQQHEIGEAQCAHALQLLTGLSVLGQRHLVGLFMSLSSHG